MLGPFYSRRVHSRHRHLDFIGITGEDLVEIQAPCDLTAAQDSHSVADGLDVGNDVRAQQDRLALRLQRHQHLAQIFSANGIEPAVRFVEK